MDFQDKNDRKTVHSVSNLKTGSSFSIVRTDRLGDVILTLPMAWAIKKTVPNTCVSFLIRDYTKPIVERCPDVDDIRIVPENPTLRALTRSFRGIDTALFPSPRFQQALAACLARVPVRIGTAYRWYSFLFTHKIYEHRKTAEHHEAEYNLRMLAKIGIAASADEIASIVLQEPEKQRVNDWIRLNLNNSSFAVLHLGSGGSSQSWPEQSFINLALQIAENYGMNIVLTGTEVESAIIRKAIQSIGEDRAHPFIGYSLADLAALLERADIVIAGSTGPGHLAAALGTPTVGLFPLPLPISKARWGFRGTHAMNVSPEPVAGCPNCNPCTCMDRISVSTVFNEVHNLITPDSSVSSGLA